MVLYLTELFVTGFTGILEELGKVFSVHGKVVDFWLSQKKGGRAPAPGAGLFGVVRMATHDEAVTAKKALHNSTFNGRVIGVKWASNQRVLWVGGLGPQITSKVLEEACAQFGPVEKAIVAADALHGTSQRYGFVTFEKREDATRAVQMCRQNLFLVGASPQPLRMELARTEDLDTGFTEDDAAPLAAKHRGRGDTAPAPGLPAHFALPGTPEHAVAEQLRALRRQYEGAKRGLAAQLAEGEALLLRHGAPPPAVLAAPLRAPGSGLLGPGPGPAPAPAGGLGLAPPAGLGMGPSPGPAYHAVAPPADSGASARRRERTWDAGQAEEAPLQRPRFSGADTGLVDGTMGGLSAAGPGQHPRMAPGPANALTPLTSNFVRRGELHVGPQGGEAEQGMPPASRPHYRGQATALQAARAAAAATSERVQLSAGVDAKPAAEAKLSQLPPGRNAGYPPHSAAAAASTVPGPPPRSEHQQHALPGNQQPYPQQGDQQQQPSHAGLPEQAYQPSYAWDSAPPPPEDQPPHKDQQPTPQQAPPAQPAPPEQRLPWQHAHGAAQQQSSMQQQVLHPPSQQGDQQAAQQGTAAWQPPWDQRHGAAALQPPSFPGAPMAGRNGAVSAPAGLSGAGQADAPGGWGGGYTQQGGAPAAMPAGLRPGGAAPVTLQAPLGGNMPSGFGSTQPPWAMPGHAASLAAGPGATGAGNAAGQPYGNPEAQQGIHYGYQGHAGHGAAGHGYEMYRQRQDGDDERYNGLGQGSGGVGPYNAFGQGPGGPSDSFAANAFLNHPQGGAIMGSMGPAGAVQHAMGRDMAWGNAMGDGSYGHSGPAGMGMGTGMGMGMSMGSRPHGGFGPQGMGPQGGGGMGMGVRMDQQRY